MKILILIDDLPSESCGGAEISTLNLAHGLKKAGHDIFIITTCREKSDEGEINHNGVRISKIFTKYHERWRAYLSLYNPQTVKKVEKLMKEINPDVIHAHNIHYYLSYHCLKIAKKLNKPVFLTARDTMLFSYGKLNTQKYLKNLDSHISWFDNLKQAKKRYNPLRNIVIRHYLKYVDKIFAISQSLQKALKINKIKNVEIIYNGINVDDWYVENKEVEAFKNKYNLQKKKIIFFGGRISTLKGSEQIKQALTEIKREIPEAFLLIVGKDGVGWLEGRDLKAAYHAADVVVTPSIYLDPFNRINIEAMACKKPVVGTCFGGTPEIIQDGVTGFIVNPLDTKLMAKKIIHLLKTPVDMQRFGEAGYERVRRYFNLDICLDKNIAWYQKI